jgi:hypothetical protein
VRIPGVQMMRLSLILWSVLVVAACSGAGNVVEAQQDALDRNDALDTRKDAVESPQEVAVLDLTTTDVVDSQFDVGLGCLPGEGCFGDHCQENGDCQSGWCVEHLGDGTCTQYCVEECPPGWTCREVGSGGPDVEFICVSSYANLCKPCGANLDCVSVGGAQDACLDYGEEGSFCGGVCLSDDDCPFGFACHESPSVDGTSTSQCIAVGGVCPCSDRSTTLGLVTPCSVANAWGVCPGQRVCTADGLTDCNAQSPMEEMCNGLDDDCDGDTDEPTLTQGEFVGLCDDGNDCTVDSCSGEAGCLNVADDGAECKDGDPCTVADLCVGDVCVGTLVQCHDENPCTDDACDETGGCHFEPNTLPCDDGDPCTVADTCSQGSCQGFLLPCDCMEDSDCAVLEDGDLCNGTLMCDVVQLPHKCVVDPETVVVCDPVPGPCQAAQCAPETGVCEVVATNPGALCDDQDACTVLESCVAGACTGGVPVNCNDGNACTADGCDPDQGCSYEAIASGCDDGNPCTLGDACVAGQCQGGQLMSCDDQNPCTADECSPEVGCVHTPTAGDCNDGNACTQGDYCSGGKCLFAGVLECGDDNVCTDDTCDPESGCQSVLNKAPCDDGNICTLGDSCHLGECTGAVTLDCDDGNLCTDDQCDPQVGCTHLANAAPCDDANLCTVGDACTGGSCVGGAAKNCDDGNGCTLDYCLWNAGCQHVLIPDGGTCAEAGICQGACVAGQCTELAVEVCDGLDNNCNDTVDEGFPDSDGDGEADCIDADDDNDLTPDEADCAPLDGSIHPGAIELCGNGVDEDCADGDMPDTDQDTVCDDVDLCPGGDDTLDVNGDQIPDSCAVKVLLVEGYGSEDTQNQLEQWGFTVTVTPGSNLTGSFDYSPYDVVAFMYNSSLSDSSNLAVQNAAGKVGVVIHRGDNIVGPMGLGPGGWYQDGPFAISDNTHFISEVFGVGPLPLDFVYKSRLESTHADARVLGTASLPSLVVHKTLRRVLTPYYGHSAGMPWNANAAVVTWRSYVWAAGVGGQ